ncbi:MAG TPA: Crp/Fnr family transcriptional regulator [Candidatus Angelobacter sp.]|nr:Crp/Fnr family transcriptional regulator [Candidatus Angelobacter sp.]
MSSGVETRPAYKNNILASLSRAEIGRLAPHLSFSDLPVNQALQEPNEEITHAYFLESGMASVVVEMADGNTVETGITGKEGLVGFSLLLGISSMPTRTFIQIPATGYKIKARRLKEEFENSGELQKQTHCYMQAYMLQTGQIAACNRLHDIAERLARWLLMCHDRMDSDNFSITHEFLGHMLGTPRTTVTLAAGILQKAGFVDYTRGRMHIRDRQALEKAACECYGTISKEFQRLGVSAIRQAKILSPRTRAGSVEA